MPIRPSLAIFTGAALTVASAYLLAEPVAPGFIERLERDTAAAIVEARFLDFRANFQVYANPHEYAGITFTLWRRPETTVI